MKNQNRRFFQKGFTGGVIVALFFSAAVIGGCRYAKKRYSILFNSSWLIKKTPFLAWNNYVHEYELFSVCIGFNMQIVRLDSIQSGFFAFLENFSQSCYYPHCQKSIFGMVSINVFKVFLPAMQLAALSCRDLERKGTKELTLTPIHGKKGGEKL